MTSLLDKMTSWQKTLIVVIHDSFFSLLCFYISFCLRLGTWTPDFEFKSNNTFPIFLSVLLAQLSIFYLSGMYKSIWRFSSVPDLLRILKGVSISIPISILSLFLINRLQGIPRTVFIIDWILLVISLSGGRLFYRVWRSEAKKHFSNHKDFSRVLLVGAGAGGEQLIREAKNNPNLGIRIVGIVDDDRRKKGRLLLGIKVFYGTRNIKNIIQKLDAHKVIVAIPSIKGSDLKQIMDYCSETSTPILTLPKISDMISSESKFKQLREVKLEDILGRQQVNIDDEGVNQLIRGKKVLITGAGGSIGSGLVQQILKFHPIELIAFEVSELNTYTLQQKVASLEECSTNFISIIGDIRNYDDISQVVEHYRPDIVFHAAAYKHVPIMEDNPREAVKTNILGTLNVARVSVEYGVYKFLMISTDKAINPTNVMGATKRAAEMICQRFNKENETKFIAVRFGNVLESSGSVVPLFRKQLKQGGPLTVTHPEVTRYFMSIPEATQLVLQACSQGNGGEVFVLEMGKPVRILDLAKQMIALSGLKYQQDIGISFIGLRPGEKLYEELFSDNENTIQTQHPMVRAAKSQTISLEDDILVHLEELLDTANSKEKIKSVLKKIVKTYQPDLHRKTSQTKVQLEQ